MDTRVQGRLEELLDKQEIHEVLMRYCRGVDWLDRDLVMAAFHSDAVIDFGGTTRIGEEAVDWIAGRLKQPGKVSTHFVGNELVEVEGDLAYSETYSISIQRLLREGVEYVRMRGLRYVDRFERRQGSWKIAHRIVVDDWSRSDSVTEHASGVGSNVAQLAPDDPVYLIRQLRGRA